MRHVDETYISEKNGFYQNHKSFPSIVESYVFVCIFRIGLTSQDHVIPHQKCLYFDMGENKSLL